MTKVAIIYGMTEGPWQGKGLRKELKKHGFQPTSKPWDADIIIAHSGGCFMVPDNSRANIIMLVGLPHWPKRHPLQSLRRKISIETKNLWWYKKTAFNALYLFLHPIRWFRMYRAWKQFSIPNSSEEISVIAIRNNEEHFLHPTASVMLAKENGWQHEVFAGHHDDIWLHPEPYVNRIIKEYDMLRRKAS